MCFVQAVQDGKDADLLEDEDDDDFLLDWDELLAHVADEPIVDVGNENAAPERLDKPTGPRTRGRKNGAYIYQPKWQRWNFRERPLESTVRLRTGCACATYISCMLFVHLS